MLSDCRIRLFVQNTLLFGERVDFARKLIALPPELLHLRVVAVTLLLKCRCRPLPHSEERSGKRRC